MGSSYSRQEGQGQREGLPQGHWKESHMPVTFGRQCGQVAVSTNYRLKFQDPRPLAHGAVTHLHKSHFTHHNTSNCRDPPERQPQLCSHLVPELLNCNFKDNFLNTVLMQTDLLNGSCFIKKINARGEKIRDCFLAIHCHEIKKKVVGEKDEVGPETDT